MGRGSFGWFVPWFAVLGACSSTPPTSAVVTLSEAGATLEVDVDARVVRLARAGAISLELPLDAFQLGIVPTLDASLSYDPYWLEHEDAIFKPEPPAGLTWIEPTAIALGEHDATRARLSLTYGTTMQAQVEVDVRPGLGHRLRWSPLEGPEVAFMRLRPRTSATEGFYGLGGWADAVDHRGRLRPMQLEPDLTIESANTENGVVVPFVIGTQGWGLFVKSRRVGAFDLGRKAADRVEITFGTAAASRAEGLEIHLWTADSPLDLTRAYYAETGAPRVPAPWALGPWIWRDENRDQAEFEDDLDVIRRLDLATTAVWIDRPYATHVNTFDWKAEQFPTPDAMIAKAHALGFRMALWSTPYLERDAGPLLDEARRRGFFPPVVGTRLNPWGDPLDLTNADAFAWWQGLAQRYAAQGIEGFKLDYAQDVLTGLSGGRNVWRFADGSDDLTMHHTYQELYHRVYDGTLAPDGGFLLCRAGRWGGQRWASVIWPGDMDATLTTHRERFVPRGKDREVTGVGGLPATVIQGMGLGPIGYPLYGADTGGYRHSPPDRETYVRWFEQTAASTVMQVGDSSSQPPWVFTAENGRDMAVVDLYRVYARLHLRLFPYLWTQVQALATTGRAIQRPVALAYPSMQGLPLDGQYLLGDELLVAPVVARGATTKRVHFPPGAWVDVFTGERFEGGASVEVPAPLEKLPLYLRVGGLVPMLRPTIDTLSPVDSAAAAALDVDSFATRAGPLHVRGVLGAAGAMATWDGARVDATADGRYTLTPGATFSEGFVLELHAPNAPTGPTGPTGPTAIEVDGRALQAVSSTTALAAATEGWVSAGGLVHVRVGAAARAVTVR